MSSADFERQLAEFEAQQEANLRELATYANYHGQPFTQQSQGSHPTQETSPVTFWSRLYDTFNSGLNYREDLGEYLFQTPVGGGEIPVIADPYGANDLQALPPRNSPSQSIPAGGMALNQSHANQFTQFCITGVGPIVSQAISQSAANGQPIGGFQLQNPVSTQGSANLSAPLTRISVPPISAGHGNPLPGATIKQKRTRVTAKIYADIINRGINGHPIEAAIWDTNVSKYTALKITRSIGI